MLYYSRDLNGSFINEHYAEIALLTVLNVLQNRPRKDLIKPDHCLVSTKEKPVYITCGIFKDLKTAHCNNLKRDHCFFFQLIITSLKAIQDILPSGKNILKRHLGQILITIKVQ